LLPDDRHILASDDQPFFIDETKVPALAALSAIPHAATPEEWVEHAEVILSAGLVGSFWKEIDAALGDDVKFVEVIEFADTAIPVSAFTRSQIWAAQGLYQVYLPYWAQEYPERTAQLRARWSNDPWNEETATAFSEALQNQRWGAFDALGTFMVVHPPFARKVGADDTDLRWAILILGGTSREYRRSKPTVVELREIGGMIIRDSDRSPHLLPLVGV
jgi:hypothetical protein